MSRRISFWLAVLVLLTGAAVRLIGLASLPPGMSVPEAKDAQIAELIRLGQVEVLYNIGSEGREGLYHTLLSVVTTLIGNHPFGYRMLSVWIGLLTLALVYALARQLYGRATGLAAMGALLVPLWAVLLSRTIVREALLPLILISSLTALTYALPVYRRPNLVPNTIPFAFLGLVLGLGFYVHPVHYVIVLVCMVFIAYMIVTRQPMSRRTLSYLSFTIVILVIVATPYLISSLRLPHLNGATRLLGEYALIQEDGVGLTLLNSLGGIFIRGDENLLHNVPNRPYIDALSGMLIVLGIFMTVRRALQPRYAIVFIAALLLFPVALNTPSSPNFLGYSVILPLLAITFGLGVKQLFQWVQRQPRLRSGVVFGVVALLVFNLGWTLYSLHITWAQDEAVRAAFHERVYQIATYLDDTVSDTNTVVCVPRLPDLLPVWHSTPTEPATLLALMMDNPDEARIRYVNCGTGMVLTNGGSHQQVIFLEPDGLNTLHPYVNTWVSRGDVIDEGVPPRSVVSMIVDTPLSDTIGRFTTTAPTGFAPESPGGVAPAQLPVRLSDDLTFLGYEDQQNTYEPGEVATAITYWRVDGELPPDLSLFTHVLFDAQTIVSQTDTISVLPGRLQNRDIFLQVTFVPIPQSLPPGTYQTSTGAYELTESVRLTVLDNGRPRGTRLFINEIVVQ